MRIEHQVCTMEQAKILRELNIIQASTWYWEKMREPVLQGCARQRLELHANRNHPLSWPVVEIAYAAYTSAELGVMLPDDDGFDINTYFNVKTGQWVCALLIRDNDVENSHWEYKWIYDGTGEHEAEARADTLIYLLEHKMITVAGINARLMSEKALYQQ